MSGTEHKPAGPAAYPVGLHRAASQPWAVMLAVAAILLAVLAISLQRTHFGTSVEFDFTGTLGQDARRILAGEPLMLNFHPPGYSIAAAWARLIAGEWLAGALWISGLSAAILLVASAVAFRRLAGTAAAWGSLVACACSTPFFVLASVASSDMMFAALIGLLFLLIVLALDAPHRPSLWFLAGFIAACALLTRTNGLAAAAVLAAPLFVPAEGNHRWRLFGMVVLGFLLPLGAWSIYAAATSSPLVPTRNFLNVAVAVFGDTSQPWGERAAELEQEFGSTLDVLTRDPGELIARLAQRYLVLPLRLGWELTWPPIAALAVAGFIYMLTRRGSPAFLLLVIIAAGMTLISGILQFSSRFHLVLIPFIGAMAGVTCALLATRLALTGAKRLAAAGALLAIVGVVAARAYAPTLAHLESTIQFELAEAVPAVLHQTEPGATIYAHKANLAFETDRTSRSLRHVTGADSLHEMLCLAADPSSPAYLYLGTVERQYRQRLTEELSAPPPVAWLDLVASGDSSEWLLYRIAIERPDAARNQNCGAGPAADGG